MMPWAIGQLGQSLNREVVPSCARLGSKTRKSFRLPFLAMKNVDAETDAKDLRALLSTAKGPLVRLGVALLHACLALLP